MDAAGSRRQEDRRSTSTVHGPLQTVALCGSKLGPRCPRPSIRLCFSAAGTRLPGGDSAVAEGNTLGKGPMLFHLPQSMVASLQAQVCLWADRPAEGARLYQLQAPIDALPTAGLDNCMPHDRGTPALPAACSMP